MDTNPVFKEKQYLGRDFNRISIRAVMVLFCLAAYYITERRERDGDLFLLVGAGIFVVSIIMLFMVHYRTTVRNKSLILDGLWTTKLIKIDLNSIVKIERGKYSSFIINNPVYNLHQNGKIRFYASGCEAIYLTDRDGLQYIIGTQKPEELEFALKAEMQKR